MKFFELIPANTNFAFIQHRWRYISVSLVLIALSVGAMVKNYVQTGQPLNYGIDFAGGSQVRIAMAADKDPGVEAIRDTLIDLGYEGSGAVVVPDADNELILRVKETVSLSGDEVAACEQAAQHVGEANLLAFQPPSDAGSKMFLRYDKEPSYRVLQQQLNDAGCEGTADQGFGAPEGQFPVEFALMGVGAKLQEQLNAKFGAGTVTEIVRSETVGPKVGGQLKQDAAKAMLYAIAFIFLFVMVRFDLRFAPGGILALAHDAFLVVGAFALTGKEFTLQIVAAVLTIIGYSINDTIVVFDRVRERVALYRDDPIEETTNRALNDTLSRTILTSGTTLLVVLSTYFLGSGSVRDFSFALIVGMAVGTYSSLYIATPMFLWVNHRFYAGRGHLKWLETTEREGTGALLGGDAKHAEAEALAQGDSGDMPEPADDDEDAPRRAPRRRRRPRPE